MVRRVVSSLSVLRVLGAVLAISVALFLHFLLRVYAMDSAISMPGHDPRLWIFAPVVLYGIALLLSFAFSAHAHAARIAAFGGVIAPPCVLAALMLNVHFIIPAIVVAIVLIFVGGFVLGAAE